MTNHDNLHIPVLLRETLNVVKSSNCDVFVDGTLGRGGHFFNALSIVNNAVGIDYNQKSIKYVSDGLINRGYEQVGKYFQKGSKNIFLSCSNFVDTPIVLEESGFRKPDVVLVDLGISTEQIKNEGVGISFLQESEPLDMRVDNSKKVKASDLLNALSQKELELLFRNLGECSNYKSIARQVVDYRKSQNIVTVGDFVKACSFKKIPGKKHSATKPFMALRVAVNSEHTNLAEFLLSTRDYVIQGTKLLVISFHSLEQQTIKKFIHDNNLRVTIILPSNKEIAQNNSSRSAKLNVIEI